MPTPLTPDQVPPTATWVRLVCQGRTTLPEDPDILMLEPGETCELPPFSEIDIRTGGDTWQRFLSGSRETTLTGPLVYLRPRKIASPEKTALSLQDTASPFMIFLLGIFGWPILVLIAERTGHGGNELAIALGTFTVCVYFAVAWYRIMVNAATSNPGRVFDRKAVYRKIKFLPPKTA